MRWDKAIKTTLFFCALGLVCFFLFGRDIFALVKFISLSIALSIITIILYPHVRGVKKGDRVLVIGTSMPIPLLNLIGRSGIALNDSKVGSEIRVKLDNGLEVFGIVESYEGFFQPAKVRVVYEEKPVEMK
jgi:hypothetical protein